MHTFSLLLALPLWRLVGLIDLDRQPALAFCECFPNFNQSSPALVITDTTLMTSTTRVSFCANVLGYIDRLFLKRGLGLETFGLSLPELTSDILTRIVAVKGILQRLAVTLQVEQPGGVHRLSICPEPLGVPLAFYRENLHGFNLSTRSCASLLHSLLC